MCRVYGQGKSRYVRTRYRINSLGAGAHVRVPPDWQQKGCLVERDRLMLRQRGYGQVLATEGGH